jgi:hypothetical protein
VRSKEEFYNTIVKEAREILKDPAIFKCSCPKVRCEWHGKCQECVALHRYYRNHVPSCFQQFIKEKITVIAQIGDLDVIEKEITPSEYWDYVREQIKRLKTKFKPYRLHACQWYD